MALMTAGTENGLREQEQSLYRREHFQERGECQPAHDHRL
jgi:hypothetical protein